MKPLGESVALVYPDGLGSGHRIVSALRSASLSRSVTKVRLSLESYGSCNFTLPLEIVNYSNDQGKPMVSFVIITQEAPSDLHSCAAHEILQYIMQNAPIEAPAFTIFILTGVPFPQSYGTSKGVKLAHRVTYNDEWAAKEQMFSELLKAPDNLQFNDEFLGCLVHLIQVMGLPTVLLLIPVHRVNPLDTSEVAQEKASAFQAMVHLGEFIAQWLGLSFSGELMDKDLPDKLIIKPPKSKDLGGLYT